MALIHSMHSVMRWLVLVALIYALFRALLGMMQSKPFTGADHKAGFFLTLVCDIQLLLGLYLYITGPMGWKNVRNRGMGAIMPNAVERFFAVEHIAMMVLAIVLVHIGRSRSKKALGETRGHRSAFWFYLIALVLILASIPWPFRTGFEGYKWF
ncbi:MAG: hypothetical protein JNM44_01280 [Chitinophagaceae bacterium]|nr:hypothetical protein [Chitinophagaceae bacterium]